MVTRTGSFKSITIMLGLLLLLIIIGSGCNEQKPTFLSFMGEGNESVEKMKPIVESLKEEYGDRVVFKEIDWSDEGMKEKYSVTMNPTFIVLNVEGEVKETYMGAAHEDMLRRAIEGQIPADTEQKATTVPDAQHTQTAPASSPFPTDSAPVPTQ